MCCFAGPIRSVANTRIFARLSGHGTQYLAYQMKYASEKQNAMILPLPAKVGADENSIKFIDLSNYSRFFSDLQNGFPSLRPMPMSRAGAITSVDSKVIKVHAVGSFVASFVPSLQDFGRLDPQFVIPKEVWAQIPSYADYSFAIFQLKDLQGETHPMAFEFETRNSDQIFFPTVHIHDGRVHEKEHFEHELYCQHEAYDQAAGTRYTATVDRATKLVRSKSKAADFVDVAKAQGLVASELWIHRRLMIGDFANTDVILRGAVAARAGAMKLISPGVLLPIAALLPLGWFIQRRHKLLQSTSAE